MTSEPLAYFLTWTTYGTWLPGDERGWVKPHRAEAQPAKPRLEAAMRGIMREPLFKLTAAQRRIVEETIRAHCEIRGWNLWAVNCRSNHVHVVVTADRKPEEVMNQFKSWCTRRLKQAEPQTNRQRWWTRDGSKRYINREDDLESTIVYVVEAQDKPRE